MTTLKLDESEGPGTHVFIVGVGRYDHLRDGRKKLIDRHGGMGQLTSSPVSAAAMLKWCDTALYNPRAPLRSIEAIISVADGSAEYVGQDGAVTPIEDASFKNFEGAAKAWFDRANSHPDNVAIFYFCGHGLGDGMSTQLLPSNYGESARPMRDAINFNGFRMAMHACQAKSQIFFIDACRVVDSALLIDPNNLGESGLGVVNPMRTHRGSNPVFFAARNGGQAFGDPGQVSDFTKALLSALTKHGVRRNRYQEWAVTPQVLQQAIAALMDDSSGANPCEVDGISGLGFELHVLQTAPEFLIRVSVDPSHRHEELQLRAVSGDVERLRGDLQHPWHTTLPHGEGVISGSFAADLGLEPLTCKEYVCFPLHEIQLGVQ